MKPLISIIIGHISDSKGLLLTMVNARRVLEDMPHEFIIIDNGSTEKELVEAKRIAFEFGALFLVETKKGPLHAHHRGLLEASGEYVLFPDCHILYSPNFFHTMIKKIEDNNLQCLAASYNSGDLPVDDSWLEVNPLRCGDRFTKEIFTKNAAISAEKGDSLTPISSTEMSGFVIKRDWLYTIGGFFPASMASVGGYVGESFLVTIPTWLFGEKVLATGDAFFYHFGYRGSRVPEGVVQDLHVSVLFASNLMFGNRFNDSYQHEFGALSPLLLEQAYSDTIHGREFIEANKKCTIDSILDTYARPSA